MEDFRPLIQIAEWISVLILTLGLFSYVSKKTQNLGRLLLFVILPVWLIIAISRGFENLYYDNSLEIYYVGGIALLMAETFAILVLFGGIPFFIKYRKLKRNNSSKVD